MRVGTAAARALGTRAAWSALALAIAACGGETFYPSTVVDRLRVLAVQAEPPEVAPGGVARLTALVADPAGTRPLWQVWLACDPKPASQLGNRCAQISAIREPRQLFDRPETASDFVRVLGTGDEVTYRAPADLFEGMPADALARRRGLTAVVLLLVAPVQSGKLDEDLRAAAENRVENALVIKRLKIRETSTPNKNPVLLDVRNEGAAPGVPLAAPATGPARIVPVIEDGASESYVEIDADGRETQKVELITTYWFTTAGRWDRGKTQGAEAALFTAPGEGDSPPPPPERRLPVWVVIRDPRGGASWTSRSIDLE